MIRWSSCFNVTKQQQNWTPFHVEIKILAVTCKKTHRQKRSILLGKLKVGLKMKVKKTNVMFNMII